MASITIKELPSALHRALKKRAAAHSRSLNKEIIATLQEATAHASRPALETMLEEAKAARRQFKRPLRVEEISNWKRSGRP